MVLPDRDVAKLVERRIGAAVAASSAGALETGLYESISAKGAGTLTDGSQAKTRMKGAFPNQVSRLPLARTLDTITVTVEVLAQPRETLVQKRILPLGQWPERLFTPRPFAPLRRSTAYEHSRGFRSVFAGLCRPSDRAYSFQCSRDGSSGADANRHLRLEESCQSSPRADPPD